MASLRPRVSVLTTTYNHENFIEQAVESVVTQETSFPFELVVGEDCSTDKTRSLLLKLKQKHPDIIRLHLRNPNWGRRRNFVDLFYACQGDFIAILEGDDFWTDTVKLQKQVEFLDQNQDFSIVFHPVYQYREKTGESQLIEPSIKKDRFILDDLIDGNFIHTCSVMFRNHLFEKFPKWFQIVSAGDYPLHILNAEHGDIGYLPEPMATYRMHSGGVWSSQPKVEQIQSTIQYTTIIRDYLQPRYTAELNNILGLYHLRVVSAYIRNGKYAKSVLYTSKQLLKPTIPRFAFWRAWRHHRSRKLESV